MLELSNRDLAMRDGVHGDAAALAMRILTRAAEVMGAPSLIDIEGAHIDGCLYHGAASLDFVERLVAGGGKVVVPTTREVEVTIADLMQIRSALNQGREGDELVAVSVGTPHFSLTEFAELERLLSAQTDRLAVDFYVNTSRFIPWELEQNGAAQRLQNAGVQIVTDTCTYITPVMRQTHGLVMTNSGKWAYYAPATIGIQVAYGSLYECVRSAISGRVWFDEATT